MLLAERLSVSVPPVDPILLFFISGAGYAMVHFRTLVTQPFTTQWWIWLSLTGLMLAG